MVSDYLTRYSDAIAGCGLVVVLSMIVGLDYQKQTGTVSSPENSTDQVVVTEIVDEPAVELKLAVTEKEFDDMGRLLNTLGEGYRYRDISKQVMLSSRELSEIDVLFLTCSMSPKSWLGEAIGATGRGAISYGWDQAVLAKVKDNLTAFVHQGGTLYVSDWHYSVLSIAFDDVVEFSDLSSRRGAAQSLNAKVVDPALRQLIGESIPLHFDQSYWTPALVSGPEVTSYLEATYETVDGTEAFAPLLVKFNYGQGAVIFTSFHNETQNSEIELQLLKFLVFAAVMAKTESEMTQTMVEGGFSPTQSSLLTADSGPRKTISKNYENETTKPLKFTLGFESRGGVLRLKITSPSGRSFEQAGAKTFSIEIPQAEIGTWNYEITPEKIPYDNFPFQLLIGEK